ncbi:hypothetical protein Chor_004415 [Crotalus horridus]
MGPNCNSVMSLPNYSEDTFTSLSEEEEEEEDEKQYEDDPFESYDSVDELEEPVASDLTRGAWQSSCQKDEGISEGSEEELGALQSFCASRISHLRRQRISEPLRRNSPKKQRPSIVSERQLTGGDDCAVPSELVNRLHLKSLKEMMKQKRAEFAEVEFLRRKKTILDNVLLQEKLEDYMYTKDSLTLIGEIHKSLPKLSEDPSIIWQELNKRGCPHPFIQMRLKSVLWPHKSAHPLGDCSHRWARFLPCLELLGFGFQSSKFWSSESQFKL